MKCIKAVTLGFILLSFSQLSMAGTVVTCASRDDGTTAKFDYGNAPSSYGSACNKTDTWQNLGPDGDWSADFSGDQYTKNQDNHKNSITKDKTDRGVKWRTSVDGGATWTGYGKKSITQGDLVQFRFQVTRIEDGNHKYDLLKSWIDWNSNGEFDNDTSEILINKKWWKNENSEGVADGNSSNWYNTDLNNSNGDNWDGIDRTGWNTSYDVGGINNTIYNSPDTVGFFTVQQQIPLDAVTKNYWLRARVVCENSLNSHSVDMNLLPTGFQDQGETEDYRFKIVAKTVDVPEPSTLFILGAGLLAFANTRRKHQS